LETGVLGYLKLNYWLCHSYDIHLLRSVCSVTLFCLNWKLTQQCGVLTIKPFHAIWVQAKHYVGGGLFHSV